MILSSWNSNISIRYAVIFPALHNKCLNNEIFFPTSHIVFFRMSTYLVFSHQKLDMLPWDTLKCIKQNALSAKCLLLVWKFNSSTVHACTKSVKRDLFETHFTSPQAATKQTPLQRRKNSLIWAVRYGVQKGFPGTICHIFVCYCKSHYLVKSLTKVLKLNDKFHAYLQILFTP